ncbi:transmembrane 220 family protein [Pontibacter roseus]|uniref:transmembrane 220 family protein n=1 Tax=Pontibacter roseus TaxID=336989 RepID=UPI001FDFFB2C|nr:transmembrane 220 family protein [Pontibacter roseus]
MAVLGGICFIVFASLQYNDPDPALWIATYLAAAVISFLVVFARVGRVLLLIACIAYAIGAVYFWPERWEGIAIGGGDIRNIEEARESLGLALCSLAMLAYLLLDRSSLRVKPL